ncbi:hypothetical protein AAC387_Pa08g1372 [Persea americana]
MGNRFIPNRSSIDLDVARYLLVDAKKGKENKNKKVPSPLKGAYRKHLAETTMMDRTRILSFWRKPPAPTNPNGNFQEETVLANRVKSSQQKRHIPKSANRTLDALELIDDYYLNLLDWSTGNILAIALGNTVYLWNASNGFSSELLTVDEENGPVTSYPSMDKIAKLNRDVSGVLFTAESPNGCTVASAGDEMLMFWNVFGTPEITKPAKKTENAALFLDYALTQLANAWLDLAVEAHLIFQDFSEKYQQTGMILNGKAVCCMHMGRFEEDAKDAETLANLVVCSLHLGKSPSRYLSQLKLTHPDHLLVKCQSTAEESFDRAVQTMA